MIYTDIEELKNIVVSLKNNGKKIIWTNGCFDLLHPGHIETFKQSKEYGDVLIVGLNGDKSPYWSTKPGRPINDEKFRSQMLDAIRFIDYVYIYDEETPISIISSILPDVLVKGGDYKLDEIVGSKEVIDNGGKVIIIPTVQGFSTTNIVDKLKNI